MRAIYKQQYSKSVMFCGDHCGRCDISGNLSLFLYVLTQRESENEDKWPFN